MYIHTYNTLYTHYNIYTYIYIYSHTYILFAVVVAHLAEEGDVGLLVALPGAAAAQRQQHRHAPPRCPTCYVM